MNSPLTITRLATVLLLAMMTAPFGAAKAADKEPPKYDPTDAYEPQEVEGWTILVHKQLLSEHGELAQEGLTQLRHQLYQVKRNVPAPAVKKLQNVKIWMELNHPKHPCMCYHPDRNWLLNNDMNPEKARCVEIANTQNFIKWTVHQPWMVLHELAHAYHDQFLEGGHGNKEVRAAYEKAMEAKTYEKVLLYNGREVRHYAATNPAEYFAEASEAYFGTNDFYPFVRSELQRHDPEIFALLEKIWHAK